MAFITPKELETHQQLSDESLTIVRRLILCMTGDKFF